MIYHKNKIYCRCEPLTCSLPAFHSDYRLTGIGDNIAGNYVKIQADLIFHNVRL